MIKKGYIGHNMTSFVVRPQLSWHIKSPLLYLLDMEQNQFQALVQTLGNLVWDTDFAISLFLIIWFSGFGFRFY